MRMLLLFSLFVAAVALPARPGVAQTTSPANIAPAPVPPVPPPAARGGGAVAVPEKIEPGTGLGANPGATPGKPGTTLPRNGATGQDTGTNQPSR
jgi:hypothetical protein